MSAVRDRLVASWYEKAAADLKAAETLAGSSEPQYDTAIYHCQQLAEKSLKGLLTLKNIPFEKTHDIAELLQLAVEVDQTFQKWMERGSELTSFATVYRYPGEIEFPTAEEFHSALTSAKEIYDFCLAFFSSKSGQGS